MLIIRGAHELLIALFLDENITPIDCLAKHAGAIVLTRTSLSTKQAGHGMEGAY